MQSFSELSISPSLKERLTAAQFSMPTQVQVAAIPEALGGKDVIATAQTGTGKTLAFLIPVMEKLSTQGATGVSALVLVPTRELAMQVVAQYDALRSKQTQPAALLVGGLPEGRQLDAIRRGTWDSDGAAFREWWVVREGRARPSTWRSVPPGDTPPQDGSFARGIPAGAN